jgi:putative inorganic carbon (HCO3(-)) transporter
MHQFKHDMVPAVIDKIAKNRWLLPVNIILLGVAIGAFIAYISGRSSNTIALAATLVICFPFVIFINKDIKQILLVGLFLCLPISVDMTLNPTNHAGGASGFMISAFDILLCGLYILWLYEILLKREGSVRFFFPISLPGAALIAAAWISMINAKYTDLCLFEIVELTKMFFAFFYLANNLKSKKEINVILLVLIFGLILEGGLGILQRRLDLTLWPTALGGPHFIRDDRVSGTWVSTNDYSWCMTFLLPVAISLLFSKIRVIYRYALIIAIAIGIGGLLYSKSRAAMVALPTSILFISVIALAKIREKQKLYNLFFAFIAILLFSSPLYPKLWHTATYRFVNDDNGSAESRVPQFMVAWKIIKENPLLGIGVNNYSEIMWEYDTDAAVESLSEITHEPVHNIFLGITAEMGIIGFIVFFWFITAVFNQGFASIRKNDHFYHFAVIGLLGGILAFLAHGLVDAATIGNKLFMFLWVYAGIIAAINNNSYSENQFAIGEAA